MSTPRTARLAALLGSATLAACGGARPTPPPPAPVEPADSASAAPLPSEPEPPKEPACAETDIACLLCARGNLQNCLLLGRRRVGKATPWVRYDVKEAAEAFTRACDAGLAEACDELGTLHEGDALPRDYPRAAELHKKACDAGVASGCGSLARLLIASEPGLEAEGDEAIAAAVSMAEKACDKGYLPACTVAARQIREGRGAKKDAKKAFELADKACEGWERFGCEVAAELVAARKGESSQEAFYYRQRAAASAQNACEDSQTECGALAEYHRKRYGFVWTPGAYGKVAEKGCNAHKKHPEACTALGDGYLTGFSVPLDRARAHELFEWACEAGWSEGCWYAGRDFHFGYGVPSSPEKAAARMGRACELGAAEGCDEAGNQYGAGRGVAKDPEKHLALRRRACAWRGGIACSVLGRWLLLEDGHEIPSGEGRKEAVRHWSRGCNVGYAGACFSLGLALARGWGAPKDPKRARALAQQACTAGDKPACLWLRDPKKVPPWVRERDDADAKAKAAGGRP